MMKILLLEDNAADIDLITRSLKTGWPGCEVDAVTLLAAARQALNEGRPFDVALLDIKIPDGNGLEILAEIREARLDTAVIVLTGTGDEDLAVAALKAGADDYLVKQADFAASVPVAMRLALERRRECIQLNPQDIRLLYIEHNAADLDLTQRHFTRYAPNFHFDFVPHAEAALERLQMDTDAASERPYDALLVDYQLPGMNALDFIKAVRQERKLDVPIIVITGQGSEEIAVQSLKLGASDYLVKRERYLFRAPSAITNAIQRRTLLRQQQALAESEARYLLLAENSRDVIFTVGLDLTLGYISPAIFRLTGHDPKQFAGNPVSRLLPVQQVDEVGRLIRGIREAEQAGERYAFEKSSLWEHELNCEDGSRIWVETVFSVLTDPAGRVTGLLGTARDISKRKSFEETSRKLSQAVIQSPVGITITDKEGSIEYANPQFHCMSGYTLEEVKGRNPRLLKSGRQSESFYRELWETILSGQNWFGEMENRKKNGENYWVSVSISPLVDKAGAITHFVAVQEDITESKKLVEELKEAKERAEAADGLKAAFLNNISHEVRTPLNGILGFAEILVGPGLSEAERKSYFDVLNQSSKRLLDTITAYMDGSLLLSGNMQPHPEVISLNKLLRKLAEPCEQHCREKGLRLDLVFPDDALEIRTDADLLSKAFSHLLDNAVKFTESGTICFGYEERKDGQQFFVNDTGKGIAPELQEAIFDYFQQEDIRSTSGYEGSGLGLYIVKGIIELLGGRIELDSEKGSGTRIKIALPGRISLGGAGAAAKQDPAPARTGKILVVEDDASNRFYLEKLLSAAGYQFLSVENGREAVEACRQNPEIALVLMDLKMPVMGGIEATGMIRQEHPSLPVIALSAYAQADDMSRARGAGADGYLTKPFNRQQLMETIERVTAGRSS